MYAHHLAVDHTLSFLIKYTSAFYEPCYDLPRPNPIAIFVVFQNGRWRRTGGCCERRRAGKPQCAAADAGCLGACGRVWGLLRRLPAWPRLPDRLHNLPWPAILQAVELGAPHQARLLWAPCRPRPPVVARPGMRSRRRAPLRRAGSMAWRLVMDMLSHMTLFYHIVQPSQQMRLRSARAAAGRAKGAAHGAQLAVARRRQWQQ